MSAEAVVRDLLVAAIGALLGAWAGARAAQRTATIDKQREDVTAEIRNTNAAIALAFGICNSLLAAKRQHIKRLVERFFQHRADHSEYAEKMRNGTLVQGDVFKFHGDFVDLRLPYQPLDDLQRFIFERLSITGRPLNLAATLKQSCTELSLALQKRGNLIVGFRALEANPSHLVAAYFGLPYVDHRVDSLYPDTLAAISRHTDDAIWFSKTLCDDLQLHGADLAASFVEMFGDAAPRVATTDWSTAEAGLIPDESQYDDWTHSFVRHPKPRGPSFFERLGKRL